MRSGVKLSLLPVRTVHLWRHTLVALIAMLYVQGTATDPSY